MQWLEKIVITQENMWVNEWITVGLRIYKTEFMGELGGSHL
jgi:hypothetical protein